MKKYQLKIDDFKGEVWYLKDGSNSLVEIKDNTLDLTTLKNTYVKFFIKYSTKSTGNISKIDDIHVGSSCEQDDFKAMCSSLCGKDNYACKADGYLIDSPSQCNCKTP